MRRSQSTWSTKSMTPGDLSSGRAFDNGCSCFENSDQTNFDECFCGAPRLMSELEFVKALMAIGARLKSLPTREAKTQRLIAELAMLNMNLPARVWLPIFSGQLRHHVVRIPYTTGVTLNSKDKAPYLIYVEAVEVADLHQSPLPPKLLEGHGQSQMRPSKSEEHLLETYSMPDIAQLHVPVSLTLSTAEPWTPEDDEISSQV